MDNPLKTFDPALEEAASLYVLDLLSANDRRDFERSLSTDPALRELVRDLQGNLDALVLDTPSRPAPVHVWARIASEVKAAPAPIVAFRSRMAWWLPRVVAMAACAAFGAFLHAWMVGTPEPGVSTVSTQTTPLDSPPHETPLPAIEPATVPLPAAPTIAPSVDPAQTASAMETKRLRERVQGLAAQVAALNQVLTQPSNLPSGFTRLHVFRLANTNLPSSQQPEFQSQSLPDTLAALAVGQPAASNGANAHPAGEASSAGSPELPSTRSEPVPLAGTPEGTGTPTGLPLNGGQPLGFYDPETGRGAIAMVHEPAAENLNYVVWSRTTGPDGNPTIQNVGSVAAAGQPTVISFNAPSSTAFPPTFFVTLEPIDSNASTAPSGPVVAAPPPAP